MTLRKKLQPALSAGKHVEARDFVLAFNWIKMWRERFKPMTSRHVSG